MKVTPLKPCLSSKKTQTNIIELHTKLPPINRICTNNTYEYIFNNESRP